MPINHSKSCNETNNCSVEYIKLGFSFIFCQKGLTVQEANIFALILHQIQTDSSQSETEIFELTREKLSQYLGLRSKHICCNLLPVANRLMTINLGFTINKNGTEFNFMPLIRHISYSNRALTVVLNDCLKPSYTRPNHAYALIDLKKYLSLKSEYSKRIYELQCYCRTNGISKIQNSIEFWKGFFGLLNEEFELKPNKKSFKDNSIFMQRCIRNSINELKLEKLCLDGYLDIDLDFNKKSIISITFNYIRLN